MLFLQQGEREGSLEMWEVQVRKNRLLDPPQLTLVAGRHTIVIRYEMINKVFKMMCTSSDGCTDMSKKPLANT
jgi:hypothetical protein